MASAVGRGRGVGGGVFWRTWREMKKGREKATRQSQGGCPGGLLAGDRPRSCSRFTSQHCKEWDKRLKAWVGPQYPGCPPPELSSKQLFKFLGRSRWLGISVKLWSPLNPSHSAVKEVAGRPGVNFSLSLSVLLEVCTQSQHHFVNVRNPFTEKIKFPNYHKQ